MVEACHAECTVRSGVDEGNGDRAEAVPPAPLRLADTTDGTHDGRVPARARGAETLAPPVP